MFFIHDGLHQVAASAEDLKVLFSFIQVLNVITVNPATHAFSVFFAVASNVIENQTAPVFVIAAVNTHPTEVHEQIKSLFIIQFVVGAVICSVQLLITGQTAMGVVLFRSGSQFPSGASS